MPDNTSSVSRAQTLTSPFRAAAYEAVCDVAKNLSKPVVWGGILVSQFSPTLGSHIIMGYCHDTAPSKPHENDYECTKTNETNQALPDTLYCEATPDPHLENGYVAAIGAGAFVVGAATGYLASKCCELAKAVVHRRAINPSVGYNSINGSTNLS